MTQLSEEQQNRLKQIRERYKKGYNYGPEAELMESDIGQLLSLLDSDSQAGKRGYWPTLIDRGDGVEGHYCIGRLSKPGQPYWEFWNKGEWVSAGEVFVGREAAEQMLHGIRNGTGYMDLLDNNVATRMRDKCVAKVKAIDPRFIGNWMGSNYVEVDRVVELIESLTLDTEQEKQQQ